ncbi:hypothetical protein BDW22DRAFT_310291 [Trametopsis cervina]|nr:hypothetical protein BDW22DRAFT_310291 [Trametopsis cervina]
MDDLPYPSIFLTFLSIEIVQRRSRLTMKAQWKCGARRLGLRWRLFQACLARNRKSDEINWRSAWYPRHTGQRFGGLSQLGATVRVASSAGGGIAIARAGYCPIWTVPTTRTAPQNTPDRDTRAPRAAVCTRESIARSGLAQVNEPAMTSPCAHSRKKFKNIRWLVS